MARKSVPEQFARKAARRKPQERVSPRSGYMDVSQATKARLVGSARVSTDEQTTRLQLDALEAAGCHRIFQDKLGGALASRPQNGSCTRARGRRARFDKRARDRRTCSEEELGCGVRVCRQIPIADFSKVDACQRCRLGPEST